jgi:hypothetical protein
MHQKNMGSIYLALEWMNLTQLEINSMGVSEWVSEWVKVGELFLLHLEGT